MYLFHFTVLLNPDFNISNSLFSFSIDKVTTGTFNLQSVILNVTSVGEFIPAIARLTSALAVLYALPTSTHLSFQFSSNDTSQLINGIFKLHQKLPKCFKGMAISKFFRTFILFTASGNSTFKADL